MGYWERGTGEGHCGQLTLWTTGRQVASSQTLSLVDMDNIVVFWHLLPVNVTAIREEVEFFFPNDACVTWKNDVNR